jgi:hypothetical protein
VLIHPWAGSVYRIDWQVPPDYDLDAELSAELAGLLGARDGEWWVVRPDGHLAAVVAELAELPECTAPPGGTGGWR